MDERERVTDRLQELREMGHSYRAIADILSIPSDFANLRRIYTGGNVGQAIIKRVALAMGIIKPRPALDAYRPVIKPETLGMIASGQEIADMLDEMRIAGFDSDDMIRLIYDEKDRMKQRY